MPDRGVLASLLLHGFLGTLLALLPVPQLPPPPPEPAIKVEIIEAPRPSPIASPPPAAMSVPEMSAAPIEPSPTLPSGSGTKSADHSPATPSSAPETVKPARMLSAKTLADPRSRETRDTLHLLASNERIEQLCGIEAMAQVAAWKGTFEPNLLIAYAMSDTKITGNTLVADGAAFYSKKQWFNIKFRCDVTADRESVVSFEFAVGEAVPESEWESHSLPVEDEPSD